MLSHLAINTFAEGNSRIARILVPLAFAAALAGGATAQDAPYAGLDSREIAALSGDDIAALQAGSGWGLALPAELNGWPGPAHVLELADEIGLTEDQLTQVQAIWDSMNARAKLAGAELIAGERALDLAFETGEIDAARLPDLIAAAEAPRASLRIIHLTAHLETAPILTMHQKMLYDRARGYGGELDHSAHGGHN